MRIVSCPSLIVIPTPSCSYEILWHIFWVNNNNSLTWILRPAMGMMSRIQFSWFQASGERAVFFDLMGWRTWIPVGVNRRFFFKEDIRVLTHSRDFMGLYGLFCPMRYIYNVHDYPVCGVIKHGKPESPKQVKNASSWEDQQSKRCIFQQTMFDHQRVTAVWMWLTAV